MKKKKKQRIVCLIIAFVLLLIFILLKKNSYDLSYIYWKDYHNIISPNFFTIPIIIFLFGSYDLNYLKLSKILIFTITIILYDIIFKYTELNSFLFIMKFLTTLFGAIITYILTKIIILDNNESKQDI